MSPGDIKALRQALGCTAKELGAVLGLDQETVLSWERGDRFPTKRNVDRMAELQTRGPTSVPKLRKRPASSPTQLLASPDFWRLIRKLLAHADLRAATTKLAEPYADPADEPGP